MSENNDFWNDCERGGTPSEPTEVDRELAERIADAKDKDREDFITAILPLLRADREAREQRIRAIKGLWCRDHEQVDGCGFIPIEGAMYRERRRAEKAEAALAVKQSVLDGLNTDSGLAALVLFRGWPLPEERIALQRALAAMTEERDRAQREHASMDETLAIEAKARAASEARVKEAEGLLREWDQAEDPGLAAIGYGTVKRTRAFLAPQPSPAPGEAILDEDDVAAVARLAAMGEGKVETPIWTPQEPNSADSERILRKQQERVREFNETGTCFRVNKCKQPRNHTGPCDDWTVDPPPERHAFVPFRFLVEAERRAGSPARCGWKGCGKPESDPAAHLDPKGRG